MTAAARPPEALIATAAAMRAACETWDVIAAEIGRSAGRIRHWPREYPDQWNRAYRDAERQILHEAAGEGVVTLRRLCRSQNERVALAAAKELLNFRLKMRELEVREAAAKPAEPPPPPPKEGEPTPEEIEMGTLYWKQMNAMTDEECDRSLENDAIQYVQRKPEFAAQLLAIITAQMQPETPAAAQPIIAPESESPAPEAGSNGINSVLRSDAA